MKELVSADAFKADYRKRIKDAVETYVGNRDQRERRNKWKPNHRGAIGRSRTSTQETAQQ